MRFDNPICFIEVKFKHDKLTHIHRSEFNILKHDLCSALNVITELKVIDEFISIEYVLQDGQHISV